jgi:hypothetical protein
MLAMRRKNDNAAYCHIYFVGVLCAKILCDEIGIAVASSILVVLKVAVFNPKACRALELSGIQH